MDDEAALAHQPWLWWSIFNCCNIKPWAYLPLDLSSAFDTGIAHLLTEHTEFALDETKGRLLPSSNKK